MICDATLIFQLSTARSALPVQGASVLVTDPITGRNTRLTTDQSGRTHVLCVTLRPFPGAKAREMTAGRTTSITPIFGRRAMCRCA